MSRKRDIGGGPEILVVKVAFAMLVIAGAAALGAGLAGARAAQGDGCLAGLMAQPENAGDILLSWPAVAGATAYQVMVRAEGGDWFPVAPQVPASTNVYTYDGVEAGKSYQFSVVAMRGPSEPAGTFCPAAAIYNPPPCPAHLAANSDGKGGVTLRWDAVAGADGYNVYGPTWDGQRVFMGHVNVTTFQDAQPVPGMDKVYTVNATIGPLESRSCPTVALVPVPFFPAVGSFVLGVGGAFGAGWLIVCRHR
jgi:hypothetical protein